MQQQLEWGQLVGGHICKATPRAPMETAKGLKLGSSKAESAGRGSWGADSGPSSPGKEYRKRCKLYYSGVRGAALAAKWFSAFDGRQMASPGT